MNALRKDDFISTKLSFPSDPSTSNIDHEKLDLETSLKRIMAVALIYVRILKAATLVDVLPDTILVMIVIHVLISTNVIVVATTKGH